MCENCEDSGTNFRTLQTSTRKTHSRNCTYIYTHMVVTGQRTEQKKQDLTGAKFEERAWAILSQIF
jgi:hypothetical protein